MEANVSPVTDPNELEIAKMRMMEVRFDCIVKMFDFGQIQPKSMMPFVERKPLPPQWFKSQIKFSLEFLRDADPVHIGMAIKKALAKMDEAISYYETKGIV